MYAQLGFRNEAARVLFYGEHLDSPDRLRVLTSRNVDDICNVVRKSGIKSAAGLPNRGCQGGTSSS